MGAHTVSHPTLWSCFLHPQYSVLIPPSPLPANDQRIARHSQWLDVPLAGARTHVHPHAEWRNRCRAILECLGSHVRGLRSNHLPMCDRESRPVP
eukprot:scaffold113_cov339-Pavlova_lutheri.AAC.32